MLADATERAKYWDGVEKDEKGLPKGYFEAAFGSLAGQPFDYPDDPPPEKSAEW